jgi:hypothetical protein
LYNQTISFDYTKAGPNKLGRDSCGVDGAASTRPQMRSLFALLLLLLIVTADAFGFVPKPVYGNKASSFSGKYVSRRASLTHLVKSRTPGVARLATSKMVIY